MAEELKPCPFCGGEAKAFFCEESGTYDVQCQQCGALPFLGRKRGSGRFKSMDDVIAAWNRRAERTCLAKPYEVDVETGFYDCIECECGEVNDVSARYCNRCGGLIEVVYD